MRTTQKMVFEGAGIQMMTMLLVLVCLLTAGEAQALLTASGNGQAIRVLQHQSQVIEASWRVSRVAVTNPQIADVQVLTPTQVLVQGLRLGTTDLILWNEDETQVMQRPVRVEMDAESLQATLSSMFPMSELRLTQSGGSVIVQGRHRNAVHAQQLREFLDRNEIVYVDLTELAGVQQVELQVRAAEVSKLALRTLGINWLHAGSDFINGVRPGGSLGEILFDEGRIESYTLGDQITAFGEITSADLLFFLDALEENQYLRMLATPTLTALSGEEASFLAGGEYPIPVPQSGSGGFTTITIEYKEYGVRLAFRPTVLGDNLIRLFVAPEVSELTNTGSVVVEGFAIPALLTRRAETTLELRSGQSFAMAGLIKQNNDAIRQSIPLLGDLPVIGPLFRSVSYQKGESELLILVTVNLVNPLNIDLDEAPLPGVAHEAPNDWELYIEGRTEGGRPGKLNELDAQWLRDLGLDRLNGPGAWDPYYEQNVPPAEGYKTGGPFGLNVESVFGGAHPA